MTKLNVPHRYQPDGHSCVPYCLYMVLEYLVSKHPGVTAPTIEQIAQTIGTTELGTDFNSIENINIIIDESIPSVEFKTDKTYPNWDSISKDIQDQKPVILWIECRDQLGVPYTHSVVVDGYTKNKVFYKDPLHGTIEEDMTTFLPKWDALDRYAIRVKVGERVERKLTEFIKGEEKDE